MQFVDQVVPPGVMPEIRSMAPQAPQTPIFNATSALEHVRDRLRGVVGELEGRLQPVLGPSHPFDASQAPSPAPVSDLAALLGGFAADYAELADRLERLSGRVEL